MIAKLFLLIWAVLCSSAFAYPDMHLPMGNTTIIAIANTKFTTHLFALGVDGNLWHRYQQADTTWTGWIMRASADNGTWNSDPACGVNIDNRVECYIRYSTNLDVFQIYQTDAQNPDAWSTPRESSCVDMEICKTRPKELYWNTQPIFPTSDLTIVNSPVDGRLQVFYRGFDGGLYMSQQAQVSSSQLYLPPVRYDVIVE